MVGAEEVQQIHEAALRLLDEVGFSVLDAEAQGIFAAHGARLDDHRVHLSAELVGEALATAPAGYTVAGRRPELDLHVGLDAPPVFGGASSPAFVIDASGRRQPTLDDVRTAVALVQMSPNIAVHGVSLSPQDVSVERRARVVLHTHVVGSDKACAVSVTPPSELEAALRVEEILYGSDWHAHPRLWSIINTTSPLQLSAEAGQALVRLARLGQPVCVAACAMGGTTAPATLAGLLAVQHAEVLAGLVLTQLVRPGCPFLYGGTSSVSSMRSGALLMGAPEYWPLTEATVQLGHHVGLPVRAGGALTDAHAVDYQAGAESALGLAAALRAGAQFILHAAGILSSFNAYSPAKFVADDGLLGALLVAQRPLVVSDETLARDAVAAAGPGGTLLTQAHTRQHARDLEHPTLMNHEPYETWHALGRHDLAVVATERVTEILDRYSPPDDLDSVTRRQLDRYCLT